MTICTWIFWFESWVWSPARRDRLLGETVSLSLSLSLSAFAVPLGIFGGFHIKVETLLSSFVWHDKQIDWSRKISLYRIGFSFLRKSEIRSTCLFFFFFFFFLALILSCLTFLWSYSVLPFSVRRFEGKEAQYAERKKKKNPLLFLMGCLSAGTGLQSQRARWEERWSRWLSAIRLIW